MPPKQLRTKLNSALALKDSKISNFWVWGVGGLALFFDLAQAFVELIPLLGFVFALFISFLGTISLMAILYFGFGISYFSGSRLTLKIASLMFGTIVAVVPLLNLITPEMFVMVMGAILATRFGELEERQKQEQKKAEEERKEAAIRSLRLGPQKIPMPAEDAPQPEPVA